MTHTYNITGMTCNNCVAKTKSALLQLGDVTEAVVRLDAPQAIITMQQHIPLPTLQNAVHKAGNYTIAEADAGMAAQETVSWWQTYKPLLLIAGYLLAVAGIAGTSGDGFNTMRGMEVFMAGFFLSFSFFKMLDIEGFADSYMTYDILAKRWRAWGLIYPFVELGLGIAYAAGLNGVWVNTVTLVVMLLSIAGVLQTLLNKKQIRCACLGAVFNLPMSTVTVVEDALMIAMSAGMLINLL